jgi:hypothetical protein
LEQTNGDFNSVEEIIIGLWEEEVSGITKGAVNYCKKTIKVENPLFFCTQEVISNTNETRHFLFVSDNARFFIFRKFVSSLLPNQFSNRRQGSNPNA